MNSSAHAPSVAAQAHSRVTIERSSLKAAWLMVLECDHDNPAYRTTTNTIRLLS